jgi:hypothetical protein
MVQICAEDATAPIQQALVRVIVVLSLQFAHVKDYGLVILDLALELRVRELSEF